MSEPLPDNYKDRRRRYRETIAAAMDEAGLLPPAAEVRTAVLKWAGDLCAKGLASRTPCRGQMLFIWGQMMLDLVMVWEALDAIWEARIGMLVGERDEGSDTAEA